MPSTAEPHFSDSHSCSNFLQYPSKLVRPLSEGQLAHYDDLLDKHGPTLCNKSPTSITIWDFRDEEKKFGPESKIGTPDELFDYMKGCDMDPLCRYVFITSRTSRHPLNCSIPLLKSILTYHQVAPFFLDHLLTWGLQPDMVQLDPTWCHFKNHNAHSVRPRIASVPSLGRSSNQIQHSFLLRAAERAPPDADGKWRWRIRQAAAYHSFDLVTGKAFWITVKGNNRGNGAIKDEIVNDSQTYPAFNREGAAEDELDIVAASMEAALETHLIFFRWCENTWRWFIRDIEDEIRQTMSKARTHPVDEAPYESTLPRAETGFSALSSPVAADFQREDTEKPTGNRFGSVLRLGRTRKPRRTDIEMAEPPPEATGDEEEMRKEAFILGMFSHQDLQILTTIQHRLEEGRTILELNRGVLDATCQRYQDMAAEYPTNMDENTKKAIGELILGFVRSTQQIMRDLKTWETGLMTLRTKLEQGDRPMFESILQLRGSHASRMFEKHAQQSSIAMQAIAEHGKNLTESTHMLTESTHIITVILFVVFSATFAAALLQSGFFVFGDDGGWGFRDAAVVIFFILTAAGTSILTLVWLWWKRRCAKKKARVPLR